MSLMWEKCLEKRWKKKCTLNSFLIIIKVFCIIKNEKVPL